MKKKKNKKKKKKTGDSAVEQETETPPENPEAESSCSHQAEGGKKEVSEMSWEDEKTLLWAQANHIDLLTKEARAAGAQKKQAEEIEAEKNNEAFLLARAMGAIPKGASSAEKKGGSSQEALAQFLLEEIKKKEKDLECPVCFEVTFIFPSQLDGCRKYVFLQYFVTRWQPVQSLAAEHSFI